MRTDHTRYALFPNLPFFATCRRVICLSNAPLCAPTNRNSRGLVCLRRGVLFRGNVLPGRCFGRSTRRGFNAHASDLARETCVARSSRTRGRASTNPPGPEDTTSPRAPRPFVALGVARISEGRKFLEIMSGRKLFLTPLSAFFRWAFRFLAKTCETNKFLEKVHKKDAVVRPPRVRRHGHRPPLACCERRGDAIDGPFRARGVGRRGCSRLASRALFVSRHVERRERRVEPVLKFISGREPPRVFCFANRGRELCWVS